MAQPSEIRAEIGSVKFVFTTEESAAAFAHALLGKGQSSMPNPAVGPAQASSLSPPPPKDPLPPPALLPAASQRKPRSTRRGRNGGDAMQTLLMAVRDQAPVGAMQNRLTETLFGGDRHQTSNALKRMERLASRWGIEPASVVRYQEEGRSRRLWPGLRLEEFMARIASAPAATEEPASPQQP